MWLWPAPYRFCTCNFCQEICGAHLLDFDLIYSTGSSKKLECEENRPKRVRVYYQNFLKKMGKISAVLDDFWQFSVLIILIFFEILLDFWLLSIIFDQFLTFLTNFWDFRPIFIFFLFFWLFLTIFWRYFENFRLLNFAKNTRICSSDL